MYLGSIFKGNVYTYAFTHRQTIQPLKGVGNIKGARELMKVRKEKEEKECKRDLRDRNTSSRAFRYRRFGVGMQEHSRTVHAKRSIELPNQDQIKLNAAHGFKVENRES